MSCAERWPSKNNTYLYLWYFVHKQLESNLERMKLNSIAHALCTEGSCAVRMPTARWVNCERGCPPFCPNQQKSTHSLNITFRICGWTMCSGCWVCHYHYDWSSNDPSMLVLWSANRSSKSTTSPGSRGVDCCFEGAMEVVIVPLSSSFIILLTSDQCGIGVTFDFKVCPLNSNRFG